MRVLMFPAFLTIACSALFLSGCGRSPEETAEQFCDALAGNQLDQIPQFCTPQTAEHSNYLAKLLSEADRENIASMCVVKENENQNSAEVAMLDANKHQTLFLLVKIDGQWLIQDIR